MLPRRYVGRKRILQGYSIIRIDFKDDGSCMVEPLLEPGAVSTLASLGQLAPVSIAVLAECVVILQLRQDGHVSLSTSSIFEVHNILSKFMRIRR